MNERVKALRNLAPTNAGRASYQAILEAAAGLDEKKAILLGNAAAQHPQASVLLALLPAAGGHLDEHGGPLDPL